ncbi:trefoil factor 3 [Microtus ochrogaster]|uniref:Trefoil factor 3 n=1 Tax=Microtus ochrogaster TaxID=79684 RepID=A0ABM0L7J9_MICOH|nr:trefoil factor 3 [Microtus ochrogaster]
MVLHTRVSSQSSVDSDVRPYPRACGNSPRKESPLSTGQLRRPAPSQCQVPAKVRVDCGYPSVSKEECNNRGCCFDNSIRNVPWCFKPLQEAECTF